MNKFKQRMHIGRLRVLFTGIAFFAALPGYAVSITATALTGTWDCRTAAMNDSGHPGSGITFKPHSLVFTFTADGKWSMEGNGATQTRKSGRYEIRGIRLVLKNSDGSKYQDWQTDLSDDGKSLQVNDKKLFEIFEKIPTT